jgi:multisubunit Na+/H+ antiporter MnhE subunit
MKPTGPNWHRKLKIAPVYDQQIWFSVKQQVILAILAALVLDMGETARGMAAVIIGYWIGAVIILIRRPLSPSKGDLLFVRWGSSLLAAAFVAAHLVRAGFLR